MNTIVNGVDMISRGRHLGNGSLDYTTHRVEWHQVLSSGQESFGRIRTIQVTKTIVRIPTSRPHPGRLLLQRITATSVREGAAVAQS